jgi:hypothetical protein
MSSYSKTNAEALVSTKRKIVPDNPAEKQAVVNAYRKGCHGAFSAIRGGSVDEVEFDKLWNFMQTALTLMDLVPLETFRKAQRIAEMRSLIHKSADEVVHMDPRKTNG